MKVLKSKKANPLLSVLVPSIRKNRLQDLYDSITESCKYTFEMIVIGPYGLPDSLNSAINVKFVQDWGSPIRAQQIGLLHCKGTWVTWAADDGKFMPDAINESFAILEEQCVNNITLIMGKYLEGEGDNEHMRDDRYYELARHLASFSPWLPAHYLMLNVGIVPLLLLLQMGGWDCQFEACPMAYNDLAIRLQNNGCQFIIQDKLMFKCDHSPLDAGDHGPIHYAQKEHDEPLFKDIYSRQSSINRISIDFASWMRSPERWERRFGKNE